jgi:hypothetical protein
MPIYTFSHPENGKIIEIVQAMSEEHVYVDEKGVKWQREFCKPQASIDTQLSLNDPKDFVRKTRHKNYSLGQLWDKSAELSEKRGGNSGQDEMRRSAELKYEQKTGKKHPHAKKQTDFLI